MLGGARSGKSRYAQSLCEGRRVLFVATARDEGASEWRARIERHRRDRPPSWRSCEAPLEVTEALAGLEPGELALLDCVTVWLANLAFELRELSPEERERAALARVDELVAAAAARDVVAVSNEVGSGIVPEHSVAREFRDLHGRANQRLAAAAERVVLVTAGLPLVLKADGRPGWS